MLFIRAWALVASCFSFLALASALPLSDSQLPSGVSLRPDLPSTSQAIDESSTHFSVKTTRFLERQPMPVSARVKEALIKNRRRLGNMIDWMRHSVSVAAAADVQPIKYDVQYLRSLEESVFLSAQDLSSSIRGMGYQEHMIYSFKIPPEDPSIQEVLDSLKLDLANRTPSDRQHMINDLHDLMHEHLNA